MYSLLYLVVVILVILWLVGFLFAHVGGGLIHIILVIAVILFLFQFLNGRRTL